MNSPSSKPHWIQFPQLKEIRGSLSFIEFPSHIPFDIKRIYYIYDVPGGESRGAHAHKDLEQVFIAMSGGFQITLDDGLSYKESFYLTRPDQGLYVPKGLWRDLGQFTSGAMCLVLASQIYQKEDYIRDYTDFLAYKKASGLE
jgi:mannose-6-phosphate isomerase-like protein (cupin superfamily)